jgi:hypothetical protein
VREIRMLRSTRRGLETWHGRDGVTLADERASQQILCGWTAAGLGRLSFHTSMEATDAANHLRDRCRDHRPRE